MATDTRVVWNTRRLSREFNISPNVIGTLLKSLGANLWSTAHWYFDLEEYEEVKTKDELVN